MTNTNVKDTKMQNADDQDVRMPYNTPELRVHGEIAQLTQAASTQGRRDNAVHGPINKS